LPSNLEGRGKQFLELAGFQKVILDGAPALTAAVLMGPVGLRTVVDAVRRVSPSHAHRLRIVSKEARDDICVGAVAADDAVPADLPELARLGAPLGSKFPGSIERDRGLVDVFGIEDFSQLGSSDALQ
jgi:hypothetical protein